MSIKVSIETEGLKELNRALNKLPDKVGGRVLQSAVTSAIRESRKEIKANAPRGQGLSTSSKKHKRLRQNIKVGKARTKRGLRSAYVSTGKAFWGFFLEHGTRYISAKPWFAPAFVRSREKMITQLRIKLGAGIDKEFKKLK